MTNPAIKPATRHDIKTISEIINDSSTAYKGIIPHDRWHEPYMPEYELLEQIKDGVKFYCYHDLDQISGVMGIQDRTEFNLIRHAYTRTNSRNNGIGSALLEYLVNLSKKSILIGTWKDATWAIKFYEKHGFTKVPDYEKNILLKKYWKIPERQIETSVVLADQKYSFQNKFCNG